MGNEKKSVIIVSPSLDAKVNVGGVSSVVNFIIKNNTEVAYRHFQQGKRGDERSNAFCRIIRILKSYNDWKILLRSDQESLIHYNMSLDGKSILRDYPFIRYATKKGRKVVVHIHGGLYLFKKEKPYLIRKVLRRLFSHKETLFIFLSEKEKQNIQDEYNPCHIYSLPNVVDLANASNFHRNHDNKPGLQILYLGRIEANKGMDYILRACKILKQRGVFFHLHMAGKEETPGSYIPKFEKEVGKDFFSYEGVVYGKEKDRLLETCNVFLLPSFYEGLPMSMLEAMSFGQVPVVTAVGSIGEYVKNGINGIIVKKKDETSIVEAITYLSKNKTLMSKIAYQSKKTIFDFFNPRDYIVQLNEIYFTPPIG